MARSLAPLFVCGVKFWFCVNFPVQIRNGMVSYALRIKGTVGGMLIANTPPFFTAGFEPIARVPLYLTNKNTFGDFLLQRS